MFAIHISDIYSRVEEGFVNCLPFNVGKPKFLQCSSQAQKQLWPLGPKLQLKHELGHVNQGLENYSHLRPSYIIGPISQRKMLHPGKKLIFDIYKLEREK